MVNPSLDSTPSASKLLMIPGPSQVDPQILSILARPVLPHYGRIWAEIYNETLGGVKEIFGTKEEVIILPAPGAAALEMAAANLVEPGEKVVNVINGFFGEIVQEILEFYGANTVAVRGEYGKPINVDAVAEAATGAKAIFVIHNETSTGVVNPIPEVGEVAEKCGALLIVDAVSSFGGMEVSVDRWKIDFCIGYSSKCMGGVNGVVPVVISAKAWDAVKRRKEPIRSRFLNLMVWRRYIDTWSSWGHPFPTSMPTSTIIALREAIKIALREGLENRYRRHTVVAKAMRRGLEAIGLMPLVDERFASSTVTVVNSKVGEDEKIASILDEEFNVVVARGLSKLRGKTLRIGHMGVTASPQCLFPTLHSFEGALLKLGHKVARGSAVAAACRELQIEI